MKVKRGKLTRVEQGCISQIGANLFESISNIHGKKKETRKETKKYGWTKG